MGSEEKWGNTTKSISVSIRVTLELHWWCSRSEIRNGPRTQIDCWDSRENYFWPYLHFACVTRPDLKLCNGLQVVDHVKCVYWAQASGRLIYVFGTFPNIKENFQNASEKRPFSCTVEGPKYATLWRRWSSTVNCQFPKPLCSMSHTHSHTPNTGAATVSQEQIKWKTTAANMLAKIISSGVQTWAHSWQCTSGH